MQERKLTKLIRAAFIPVVGLCLTTPAFAAGDTKAEKSTSAKAGETKQNYRAARASKLIGQNVRNPEGKNLGEIKDLIVNMNTGEVRYAMLAFDPGVFTAEKLFAVPTKDLRMSADKDEVVYNMTRERLERAGIEKDKWPSATRDRKYVEGLDKTYGIVAPSGDYRAYRASELIGKDVNSRDGNDIGEINDLVINMNAQKVHYAVLKFDPSWAAPEKLFAFPLRSFTFTDGKDELVLEVDKAKLQAMKSFDQNLWSRLNDPVIIADIDRYLVTVTPVATAEPSPAALFKRLDSNNDGSLTQAEAKASTGVHGAWAKLDKDNDGKVSRTEFETNYRMEARK